MPPAIIPEKAIILHTLEDAGMTQRGPDVNAVQYYTDKNMATVKRHTVPR